MRAAINSNLTPSAGQCPQRMIRNKLSAKPCWSSTSNNLPTSPSLPRQATIPSGAREAAGYEELQERRKPKCHSQSHSPPPHQHCLVASQPSSASRAEGASGPALTDPPDQTHGPSLEDPFACPVACVRSVCHTIEAAAQEPVCGQLGWLRACRHWQCSRQLARA